MNILLLHQYFLEENEGGGSRWNEFSRFWMNEGNKVTVLAGMVHYAGSGKKTEYKGLYFKKKLQGDVTVWRCHVSEAYNKSFSGRLWGYFSFMFSSLWAGIFKVKGKYDVVIVSSPPLFVGFSGYLISRWKRIPLVFEVRDLWPESAIDAGVLKNRALIKMAFRFETFIYRQAALINVLTPAFYSKLKEAKKVPEKKLIVIPNAADFTLSQHLLENFDRKLFRICNGLDERFVITYVGTHGIANYLEQLLNAAKSLEDTNVLFLLIGQGMEKERLKKLAASFAITNVRFIDQVPKQDVFKYIIASEMGTSVLKKADTFKTIYSNKTFDYMSCKKPILMAIDGVSRELVEEADCGIYVEPENIVAFDTAIRTYMADPCRLKTEGENGYFYAKQNFDRNILSIKYLKLIENVVSN